MPRIANHDCESTEPLHPGNGHYLWHRRHKTEPCQRSLEEKSLHQYKWRYGTIEGWNGLGQAHNPPAGLVGRRAGQLPHEARLIVKPKPRPPISPVDIDPDTTKTLGEVMPDLGKERWGKQSSYLELYQKDRSRY